MIWFTADTHFGHAACNEFCDRNYKDVDDMNDSMVEEINKFVGTCDTLWHLGDFAFNRKLIPGLLAKIDCKDVRLIFGNHDHEADGKLFAWAGHYHYLRHEGKRFSLSHYPMTVWRSSHHGSIHLHGHSHGTHEPFKLEHMPAALSFDVGVDVHNFRPISMDEIIELARKRREAHGICSADYHSDLIP